jgi:hypothetical protein
MLFIMYDEECTFNVSIENCMLISLYFQKWKWYSANFDHVKYHLHLIHNGQISAAFKELPV